MVYKEVKSRANSCLDKRQGSMRRAERPEGRGSGGEMRGGTGTKGRVAHASGQARLRHYLRVEKGKVTKEALRVSDELRPRSMRACC
jgi:hypothetical protein